MISKRTEVGGSVGLPGSGVGGGVGGGVGSLREKVMS